MKRSMVYLENEVYAFTKSLIQLLIFLFICCYGRTDGQITNVVCWNDFITEMVCSWEAMDFETNCTTKYQLFYEHDAWPLLSGSKLCIPVNVKVDGSVLMKKCACTIYVPRFHVGDEYKLEIKSDGLLLHNKTIQPYGTVKPKTPGNLTVEVNKNGDYILRWDKKYHSDSTIYEALSFEIYCYNKNYPSENFSFTTDKQETYFEIKRSKFKSGSEYVAKIRTGVTDDANYWSDYSHEVQWRSDRTNNSFTPSLFFMCFLIIPLVTICYWGIRIIKKKNWDMIPDPSKSNIIFSMVGKSKASENLHSCSKNTSDKKQWRYFKVANSHWLQRFAPCLLDRECAQSHVPTTMGNQPTNGSPEMFELNLSKKPNILMPECIIVEPFIILDKPDNIEGDEEASQGEYNEESDTSGVLIVNSSINEMFHDLLGISPSPIENVVMVRDENITSDNSEKDKVLQPKHNTHIPSVFSFFCGSNQPSKDEGSCDDTLCSPKQSTQSCESGYRSFESEVGHVDPKIYAEPKPGHDAQIIPTNQNGNCHLEEATNAPKLGFNSPYNSFSSAVSQCENRAGESGQTHGALLATLFADSPLFYNTDQVQGSDVNLQFHNYEIGSDCKSVGSDCKSVSPQNAIKHNFPFWEGEQDLLFLPNGELLSEITPFHLTSVSSKMDSATLFDPSGYKCFENAVKHDCQC